MINYFDSSEVFDFVTKRQTETRSASATQLSQLYVQNKLSIQVFDSVSERIFRMCGHNDVRIF
jgi:hypothetical protein